MKRQRQLRDNEQCKADIAHIFQRCEEWQSPFLQTPKLLPNDFLNARQLSINYPIQFTPFLDSQIPQKQIKHQKILRCSSCKAYMNPFNILKGDPEYPTAFICSICQRASQLSSNCTNKLFEMKYYYYKLTNANSLSIKKTFNPPAALFVLDCNIESYYAGTIQLVSYILTEINQKMCEQLFVGIVLSDGYTRFINLNPDLNQPQILTLVQLFDMELFNLYQLKYCRANFIKVLECLKQNQGHVFQQTCFQASIQFAIQLMQKYGGVIYAVQVSQLATKQPAWYVHQTYENVLSPSNNRFYELGLQAAKAKLTINLFVFTKTYKNCGTLGELAKKTNGNIFVYKTNDELKFKKFFYDFKDLVQREKFYDVAIRWRLSPGWKLSSVIPDVVKENNISNMCVLTRNHSFHYKLLCQGGKKHSFVKIQFALLFHTDLNWHRKQLRIFTTAIPTTSNIKQVLNVAEYKLLATAAIKNCINEISQPLAILQTIRQRLVKQIQYIKKEYQQFFEEHLTLSYLMQGYLALIKSRIFATYPSRIFLIGEIDSDRRDELRVDQLQE